MSPRSYSHFNIEKLEALFESSKLDLEKLTMINEELKHRHTKRARSLRTKVHQRIAEQKPRADVQNGPDEVFLTLEEAKKRHLVRVLKETKGNKVKVAKILGIDRRTLYRMAERFGLDL